MLAQVLATAKGLFSRLARERKGAALLEYALLIAGVALIASAAIAIFGNKTADLVAAVASVLPGAHTDDNGPIAVGQIIETKMDPGTSRITLDATKIQARSGSLSGGSFDDSARLGANLGTNVSSLILEPAP
jgi:Flp pilus assembly pilin Flp